MSVQAYGSWRKPCPKVIAVAAKIGQTERNHLRPQYHGIGLVVLQKRGCQQEKNRGVITAMVTEDSFVTIP